MHTKSGRWTEAERETLRLLIKTHSYREIACVLNRKQWSVENQAAMLGIQRGTHLLTPEERFWLKVDKSGECWLWIAGKKGRDGYGSCWFGGKPSRAHRVSWELTNGPVPDGMVVCHRCDNPPCVNPDHLFLGTLKDNAQDRNRKGRTSRVSRNKGSKHGCCKLSEADIRYLRAFANAGMKHADIAVLLECSPGHVTNILNGRNRTGEGF